MKKVYLNLFCLLIAFYGCRQSTLTPGGGNTKPDYFPLQVGNEWVYQALFSDTVKSVTRITDKVIFNNHVYYRQISFGNNQKDTSVEFLREQDNIVYIYHDTSEIIQFDFTGKQSNVTFNIKESLPIGNYDNCLQIGNEACLACSKLIFAPNIGLIKYGPNGAIADTLLHVKINGLQLY